MRKTEGGGAHLQGQITLGSAPIPRAGCVLPIESSRLSSNQAIIDETRVAALRQVRANSFAGWHVYLET